MNYQDHPLALTTGHLLSLSAIIGSIEGSLPALAAFAAFIWYMVSIYESKTVQGWITKRRERRLHARHKPSRESST